MPPRCWRLAAAVLALESISSAAAESSAGEVVDVNWALPARRLQGPGQSQDDGRLPDELEVNFKADGAQYLIRLHRNRVLLPASAEHVVHYPGGRVERRSLPPPCFYQGEVLDPLDTARVVGRAAISATPCRTESNAGGSADGSSRAGAAGPRKLSGLKPRRGLTGMVLAHGRVLTLEPLPGGGRRLGAGGAAGGGGRHRARRLRDAGVLDYIEDVARYTGGEKAVAAVGGNVSTAAAPPRFLSGAATKHVEVLVVNDNGRYEAFGGSSGLDALADHCVSVMNSVTTIYNTQPTDSASFPYNIQVVLVSVHTLVQEDPWEADVVMDGAETDSSSLLDLFTSWGQIQQSAGVLSQHDNRVLLSARDFDGSTAGLAFVSTMCKQSKTGSVNMCGATDGEIPSCAAVVSHEVGHNFGMGHDGSGNACPDSGLIMNSVMANPAPTQFSSCSVTFIETFFNDVYASNGQCLENMPTQVFGDPVCGNGFVESGEDCDCGAADCSGVDVCCNGATCTFADPSYECSNQAGACCESCFFVAASASKVCRAALNECDLDETCAGGTAECPMDVTLYPGSPCSIGGFWGLCFAGQCNSLNYTCAVDLNRDFAGNWDLTETCATYNDDCHAVVCHDADDAQEQACRQSFSTHGAQMTVPEGTPCWFKGDPAGERNGMCFQSHCVQPHTLAVAPHCGNGGIDFGEECDCGVAGGDACCDCSTCLLAAGSECSSLEPCCNANTCQFLASGTVCRQAIGECDTAETCTGSSGVCPSDVGVQWGTACTYSDGVPSTCYGKKCVQSLDSQCSQQTGGARPLSNQDMGTSDRSAAGHDCQMLTCCQTCTFYGSPGVCVTVSGVETCYDEATVCNGCVMSNYTYTFTVDGASSTIFENAAVDGTVLADSSKYCKNAFEWTPASSCSAGQFLEVSIGECLTCDSACTACDGPTNFDCVGACAHGTADSRGACPVSADQVAFGPSPSGTSAPTPPPSPTVPPTPTPAPTVGPTTTTTEETRSGTASSAPARSTASGIIVTLATTVAMSTMPPASTSSTISLSLTLLGVIYSALMADPSMLQSFKLKNREAIAMEAFGAMAYYIYVTVEVLPGSVEVVSLITPPTTMSAESISSTLADSTTLADTVETMVNEVPNIASILSGAISVDNISEPVVEVITSTAPVTTMDPGTSTEPAVADDSHLEPPASSSGTPVHWHWLFLLLAGIFAAWAPLA